MKKIILRGDNIVLIEKTEKKFKTLAKLFLKRTTPLANEEKTNYMIQ